MTAAGDQMLADLAARLDADERAALCAAGPPGHRHLNWRHRDDGSWTAVPVLNDTDEPVVMTRGDYAAVHVARHDPDRVLRDVTAVRAVMGMYEQVCQTVRERAGGCRAARQTGRRDGLDRLDIDYASAVARKVAIADVLTALAAATVRPEEAPTP